MTLGELIMYIFFIGLVAAPLVSIASIGTQITEAFAGLDRIREILDMPTEVEEDERRAPVARLNGRPDLRGRVVRVQRGSTGSARSVVSRRPGTTTALVGSSGSGKSTLISIVMAFNRPTKGRVLVDGRDLSDLRLMDYRSQLASVLQENFLFDGTIVDNVGYAKPGATRSTRSSRRAGSRIATSSSVSFRRDTTPIVGERGIKLSGGQRQRVSIARAILANPRILILDEATSSLDSESEQMIQDGLRQPASQDARRSSSRIGCRPSAAPTRSSCSRKGRLSSAALMPSCSRSMGGIGSCTTSSTSSRPIGSSTLERTSRPSPRSQRPPRLEWPPASKK